MIERSGPAARVVGGAHVAMTKLLVASVACTVIVCGAEISKDTAKDPFTPQQHKYWAFQHVARPAIPEVRDAQWVRTPVDAFILARLEAKGLKPSPPADRITLLRRVYFDVTGLPPTPQEVDAFVADQSADAYQKVVEKLLASPQYGERWARHWLDLARYADSEGFKTDETRPNAWRYRDYVIAAFNNDKPYDRFIREQIAGDELWPSSPEAHLATAFNRHYPDESNAQNLRQRRQDILNDITDTVGSVFLGMTYGCARCHNHKFDPILQADYYRLQAFFANIRADDDRPLAPADEVQRYRAQLAAWNEKTKPIRDQMDALLEPKRKALYDARFMAFTEEVQQAILKPVSERTPLERFMYSRAYGPLHPGDEEAAKGLKGADKEKWQKLEGELAQYASLRPAELPTGTGIVDIGRDAPPTHVLAGGNFESPQAEVHPGFLSILNPSDPTIETPAGVDSTGRRTVLANWLADPTNPLPPRVMVNRLWHYHFGRGIVATPSDFGIMGQRPTHPELLDWLADEFVHSGWSMKHIHRLILLSNTYQQSSAFRADAATADSREKLFWRYPRHRLESEAIRDSMLAVAGKLNLEMGGPGVYPDLPPGMPTPRGGWDTAADASEKNRRSVYIFVRRNARFPMLEVFDMPDTHESCGRRYVSTTAPQALTLLNSRESLEWAEALAGRVLETAGTDQNAQVDTAYRLAYSRRPDSWERDRASTFLYKQASLIAAGSGEHPKSALPPVLPAGVKPAQAAALVDFCHMLMDSNEFVYVN